VQFLRLHTYKLYYKCTFITQEGTDWCVGSPCRKVCLLLPAYERLFISLQHISKHACTHCTLLC